MEQVNYDPTQGLLALNAMAGASGRVQMNADEVRDALLTALVSAELLAAKEGLAVAIPTDAGVPGYIIGGARDKALATRTRQAAIYLGVTQAVRRANATITRPTTTTGARFLSAADANTGGGESIGPLAIVLIVAGVAALVAGAWYVGKYVGKVEADGKALAEVNAANTIAQLALSGQPIDPAAYDALAKLAHAEQTEGSFPWGMALFGVGVVVTGGYLLKRALG